ncbi:8-oxo-dGTP diphosphatase [Thalassobacillus sp. CUG 92003]|uniref:NUDIX hydrolase n=1 Tax=Thalassobacillus sp. CUG 92003 TaxID=2736641 RepID=UPI0015E7799E|nr:8-oxo-dGTP diphosphatase [Thalassobacillus sp. CUG 92003]
MYQQTLCFLKRNDEILMLNRDASPTQGLWNGVGGKMEGDETPLDCVIREVEEETGIVISSNRAIYKGIISWEVDEKYYGGMYAFLVNLPMNFAYSTPKRVKEGILDWKKVSWLLTGENLGVGEMIPHFLPVLLENTLCMDHKYIMHNKKLIKYENTKSLTAKGIR